MRSVNASATSFARSLTFRLSPHVADASVSGATPAATLRHQSYLPALQTFAVHLVGNPALVQLRERAEMWLESWTAGKSEPTQISRGGVGLSLKGIRPVSGSFRGRAQGRAQGRRFVIRSVGGWGSHRVSHPVSHPPPPSWGSLPSYLSLQEGSPTRTRAGR